MCIIGGNVLRSEVPGGVEFALKRFILELEKVKKSGDEPQKIEVE
mgnify:FL=1